MSENKKTENAVPEVADEELDKVSGGYDPSVQSVVLIDAIATADAACKKCGHTFTYQYPWLGGMHDGPWNHPVPDYCLNCDPNAIHDR